MRSIVAYLWEMQYLQPAGDAARGARTFEQKDCASCHNDAAGASRMVRGERIFTPFSMISLWWVHGPLMQQSTRQDGERWPQLSEQDVANLVAYMNTRP
jgi:mono/diheme cytochrome c family protein